MPTDPVAAKLAASGVINPGAADYQKMKCDLGLCDPLIVQYFRYLGELFTGHWGVSVNKAKNQPVWDMIMLRLPRTIDLTIFSILIASYLGIKIGVISAKHRNKAADTIARGFSLVGVSFPVFFLGMLLQYSVAWKLGWFEPTGYKTPAYPPPPFITGFYLIDSLISGQWYLIGDYLWHLILPVGCLSFIYLASFTRQTRSSMLEVMEQDYVRTARAKGCKEKVVIHQHTLRNAMIPTVTIIGLSIAGLLGGAVLTETTFNLDGIGTLFIDAILLGEYWLLNALVFLITIIFIVANLITDIMYALLDPRIRYA
jgi:peptide/nickel transport system permease protein